MRWADTFKEEVECLMDKAKQVDMQEDKELDIPAEIQRREDRIEKIRAAKAVIEQRAKERFERERAEYEAKLASLGTGTVGCVALDNNGKIAVATSTGGKGFEIPGRISDSATVAGNYANEFCGVSLTGVGEDIVSNATAAKIVTRVTDGFSIEKAFEKTFAELKPYDGFAGAIAIDKHGTIFHQDSHPSMVFASFDGINEEVFQ